MKKTAEVTPRDLAREALLHRLNRIQGQIEGIKRSIETSKQDNCLTNLGQVKAVHSAVKHFAEAYVETYALSCARKEGVSTKFENNIRTIIASAYLM
ncbi:MAG: hypothetical protein A2845_04480 [Candidatus Lloydbacteria bacterium RIFCSPHIGHO2_01_FULL_49_22]|uniref:Transcriptional regulator n=1 Tax=Candidatus Lloydbacteria bacterium RIFCSPHIGHO2_01_FULL_49_22 TaxID=1798658 RepID=A0A1G2CUQ4_9BACT|nr:MAG: hypothetical protein A2845_04480 [Candidatus Lloydbacteria bacterium RIFCSPHIGHO2_01_FULL_49_22]OGZ08907.1 MAG: hypothetical protein A3C14_01515 [Candidatus Lloydbacteria bacterium RIFCSPHIGHO2_02_FULL_50_18]